MTIKKLNDEEMADFKGFLSTAEEYSDSKTWIAGVKRDLKLLKPDWTQKDVNAFIDDNFKNDPFVIAVLEEAKKSKAKFK